MDAYERIYLKPMTFTKIKEVLDEDGIVLTSTCRWSDTKAFYMAFLERGDKYGVLNKRTYRLIKQVQYQGDTCLLLVKGDILNSNKHSKILLNAHL